MGLGRLHRMGRGAVVRIACACLATVALGCAAVEHGYKAQEYAGVPLQPSKGRGAERFAAELQMDETLASYVSEHGRPDYYYIVARMRAPRTAADPGVPDWHESRVRGGVAYTAKVGRTQYEVGPERVAFTVDLSASRAELPSSARLAMERINDAIFAAKAEAVTNQMIDLAERAAADRSGRTSFAQRVAGRTIRIGRRVDTGVFAYSIHP